jgi:hypothetical protein
MRKQLASKNRYARHVRSRSIASTVLCASLMVGIASVEPTAACAQGISPDMQPSAGMHMTSPLATQSAGIPLGSTEIATPGISPVVPSQSALMGTCAGSDGAGPSGAFDGGGISGGMSLSCADSRNISSPLPSTSSIGRVVGRWRGHSNWIAQSGGSPRLAGDLGGTMLSLPTSAGVAHAALAALMIVGVGLPAHFRIQLSPCRKF